MPPLFRCPTCDKNYEFIEGAQLCALGDIGRHLIVTDATLRILAKQVGPPAPYTRTPEECGYHDWTGEWGRLACVKCGAPMGVS